MRFHRTSADATRDFGIGIDFGTTNSVAAVYDGRDVTVVELEPGSRVMPSASYIDTHFAVATGNEAIRTYIDSNRGRRVELRAEVLGEGRLSTGQIDPDTGIPGAAETQKIYGREIDDAGLPGRLFHGTKRLLGSPDAERIVVFNRPFRLVALITPILLHIQRAIERSLQEREGAGRAADHACIGFPVRFEGADRDDDQLALSRLSEANRYAGIARQQFCPEPIAAAISHFHSDPPQGESHALAVDFGGGTLDLCVIRYADGDLEVKAVHGIGLGGNRIDQAIFRRLLFPMLGDGETWRRDVDGRVLEAPFPFWMYEDRLLNWQLTYTLNQNKYTTPLLDQMRSGRPGTKPFERLYHLIAQNYGYETFRAVRRLKEHLSSEAAGVLDVPEIDIYARMDRLELNGMIGELLQQFETTVDETLDKAGLAAADVDLVLRTGGSALIPAVADILEDRFPGRIVAQNPFTSVAAGLAIADYYDLGQSLTGIGGER